MLARTHRLLLHAAQSLLRTLRPWQFFANRQTRRVAIEWTVLTTLLVLLAAGLGWQAGSGNAETSPLARLDLALYDFSIAHQTRPAHPEIVIVAIDDISLAQLGRWPWPRHLHAALLDRLTESKVRAIGMDILFTEPAQPMHDEALALALARNGKVALPITLDLPNPQASPQPVLPIEPLAANAARLAHIHVPIDRDGLIRSVFLEEFWQSTAPAQSLAFPQLALALLEIAGQRPTTLPGVTAPVNLLPNPATPTNFASWSRNHWLPIPFTGPPNHYRTVSYASVLRGEVSPATFDHKFVLVGATAAGLWDAYPTPTSARAVPMPGVEFTANILDALLTQRTIHPASALQNAALCALPVGVLLIIFLFAAPRYALLINIGMVVVVLLSCHTALQQGLWVAPGAALLTLLLAYPLWSWRRLEAAIGYLGRQAQFLQNEPHLLPESPAPQPAPIEDTLARRVRLLKQAITRVRDLRRFVSDNLESLPDATLIAALDGHILLSNEQARRYFAGLEIHTLQGSLLPYLFQQITATDLHGDSTWWDLIDAQKIERFKAGIEARDAAGRDILVKASACHDSAGQPIGWIASLIDISEIRAAERQRDETLRFLSHDMRSPQVSILALLELQQEQSAALPSTELFAQIERYARKTLSLADDFVQLSRAESTDYKFVLTNPFDLLEQATDEVWVLAQQREITLVREFGNAFDHQDTGEIFLRADRSLLQRALVNLMSNAIKYSPTQRTVTIWSRIEPGLAAERLVIGIRDQGYGIAPEHQVRLFRRFQRFTLPNQPRQEGVGLGLVFVKTVVERHHGEVEFTSNPGLGTEFRVYFDIVDPNQLANPSATDSSSGAPIVIVE